jgi:hypothetical protein
MYGSTMIFVALALLVFIPCSEYFVLYYYM